MYGKPSYHDLIAEDVTKAYSLCSVGDTFSNRFNCVQGKQGLAQFLRVARRKLSV